MGLFGSPVAREITECPYCGQAVKNPRSKVCQKCHCSLDFHRKDYYQFLEAQGEQEPREMIGTCEPMRKIFHLIRKLAATDVPILITGDSGTGKEMVAQAVHERSLRSKGPFVAINCGAIPRELLESQYLVYEKGAFTEHIALPRGPWSAPMAAPCFWTKWGNFPWKCR